MSTPDQDTLPDPPQSKLVWVPVVAGIALLLAYGVYFGLVENSPRGGPDSWGQFGDFLGGLLNPVVGTITIVLLVRTLQQQGKAVEYQRIELVEQRNELRLQRQETERSTIALSAQNKAIQMQSFEQTFFAWLQSYRQFVSTLEAGAYKGVHVLSHVVTPFKSSKLNEVSDEFERWDLDHRAATTHSLLQMRYETLLEKYEKAYQSNHAVIGPLLRSLYRLIDWVDKSPMPIEDRWHYIAIARAQLTWPEMMIIAVNGATKRGSNFVPLIEKYALLDNLEAETDYMIAAMRGAFIERAPNGFPYSMRAFSSAMAKSALGMGQNTAT